MPSLLAFTAAVALAAFGAVRGTWAVGGSDSSCYALMARAFARGELQPIAPLAREAPWPDAARTFAPAGFIPSPVRPDAASPICGPGFSLLLAPFRAALGRDGIFWVTPAAGAWLVWLAFAWGRQLAGPWAGAASAGVTAAAPIVLFQVVQPMNDITAAALWLAVLVSASAAEPSRPWLMGLFTGLALLVRPNLAPAALVTAIWLAAATIRMPGSTPRLFIRHALAFGLGAAPGLAALATLHAALYGHPLATGYGDPRDLFDPAHVAPNVARYTSALLATQLGFPLLGLLAVVMVRPAARSRAWLGLGVSLAIAGVYLLYRPFDEWWYLRFLLPAVVIMTGLAAAVVSDAWRGRPSPLRPIVRSIVTIGVVLYGLQTPQAGEALALQRLERRFRLTGDVVRHRLPADAAFISVWDSGTIRYAADRPVMLWDALDPGWLDRALTWSAARGVDPYVVVEDWEEPLFRARFAGGSPIGDLDWPPRFVVDRRVRIYRTADRAAYRAGGDIRTEHVIAR